MFISKLESRNVELVLLQTKFRGEKEESKIFLLANFYSYIIFLEIQINFITEFTLQLVF